ncbi:MULTISPECIES: DUF5431 family protein [unclassified Citrobacter]|uniref:DUF5431 family protein n=1 Tax=unclassified Citrobacter TaxID=2644389 RepID=UPI003FA39DC3
MPRLICPTYWGQYTHEATCMPRQHQDSLLDAARQGEEGHVLTPSCNVPFEPF